MTLITAPDTLQILSPMFRSWSSVTKLIATLIALGLIAGATIACAQGSAPETVAKQQTTRNQDAAESAIDEIAHHLTSAIAEAGGDAEQGIRLIDLVRQVRPLGYGKPGDSSSSGRGQASGRNRGGGNRGGGSGGNRGGGPPTDEASLRARFDSMDRDRDGLWKGDEINAYMSSHPASSDGEVSFEEYQTAWKELRSGGGQRGGGASGGSMRQGGGGHSHHGGGGHGGGRGRHGGGAPRQTAEQVASADALFLASLDQDRDRTITGNEIRKAVEADVRATLDELSTNEDGESVDINPIRLERRLSAKVRRARALRAGLLLKVSGDADDSVDALILDPVVAKPDMRQSIWQTLADGQQSTKTDRLYQRLTRLSEDQFEALFED
ncbi:hypothetical protein [Crateriforma spongiae]|uniref:hypothetical protein n=1 Tax=Crateriforma spongiae TaxID=2724528 RepID=UPI001447E84A|nr:hypothetical protein [Crateriforma spongiae]